MVTDQLSMFDVSASDTETAAPRCRMCARPARWLTTQQQYAMYCAGKACSNRERICQNCDKPFNMGVDRAGTKYCGICKTTGRPDRPTKEPANPRCAWCGEFAPAPPRDGTWPYICLLCLAPIKHVLHSLKAHHVPHERARRLVEDPGCEVCGTNLLTRIRERSHGQPKALLVVDHDHDCCPVSSYSCGRCVRGLICRDCNTAAGLLADEPKRARALGDYLEAWINR